MKKFLPWTLAVLCLAVVCLAVAGPAWATGSPCDPAPGSHSITWDDGAGIELVVIEIDVAHPPPFGTIWCWGMPNYDPCWSHPGNTTFPFKKSGPGPQPSLQFFNDGTGIETPSGRTFHWN